MKKHKSKLPYKEKEDWMESKSILNICSHCHKVRSKNSDPWNLFSWVKSNYTYDYLSTSYQLSHGICPECFIKFYNYEDEFAA